MLNSAKISNKYFRDACYGVFEDSSFNILDSLQDLVKTHAGFSATVFVTQLQDAFEPERIVDITEADEDHIKG